jgi:hypothetical protein
LYQPFPSGARASVPVADGAVASYFSAAVTGALALPATSMQVPDAERVSPSGPEKPPLQDAIPDIASVPLRSSATGWLYQPSVSGPRRATRMRSAVSRRINVAVTAASAFSPDPCTSR